MSKQLNHHPLVGSASRRQSRLKALLRLAVGAGLLGLAVFYALAKFWMLDGQSVTVLDLTEERTVFKRTIDLARPDVDYVFHACCDHSTAIERDIDGRPARRFVIRGADPLIKGSHRSEIRFRPNELGQDVWFRATVHVPLDWQSSDVHVTAMQWHGTRDILLLERGRTPPLQLGIRGDRWEILKSWDQRWLTGDDQEENVAVPQGARPIFGRTLLAETPLKPGEWQEWTFFVHWSTGADGVLRAWHDGELILDDRGPNAHQDVIGPYMKAGVYVPDWTLDGPEATIPERTLAFGEIIISGAPDPFGLR